MNSQLIKLLFTNCLLILSLAFVDAQKNTEYDLALDQGDFDKVGLGECQVTDKVLVSRDAYASIGSAEWKNYRFSFEAMVPQTEEQVQIWFGFREQGRNERYLVGIKGGLQNDIEIGRMGLMGDDAFLGIRNLDFEPQTGVWYTVSVEVCKDRIRIFINNEQLPRIDVTDKNSSLLPMGKIALGGSWIKTHFRNLKVSELPSDYLQSTDAAEYSYYLSEKEKEVKRIKERNAYEPVVIPDVMQVRTEISLDGNWLFKPGYEIQSIEQAVAPATTDTDWHIMDVPNFWNPSRIWNHGETFMEEKFPKGASDTYFQKETDRCTNYTFDYTKTSIGWYRHWIDLPASIQGKHLELSFDAVSKVSEVYVNGTKAGSHIGMFGQFNVDVTDLVKPGKNVIAVKVMRDFVEDKGDGDEIATIAVTVEVTNQMLTDLPHGFFRDSPSGIWQPVKLVITDPVKIEDVYIKPHLHGADFELTVKNYSLQKTAFTVSTAINSKDNGTLLYAEDATIKHQLAPGEERIIKYAVSEIHPKLWSPSSPNLYDFSFTLKKYKGQQVLDQQIIASGFRTFETKGDYFYLNGKRYWLRGANHTPHALGINDKALAEKTLDLYHRGNIAVTRSHTIPYSKVWLDAADKMGVGVSYEGIWPWLMIGIGEGSIPDQQLLDVWKDEWLSLLKKYRNHPSLFYWTINNEMNFTHHSDDKARTEKKMGIVSDVVKGMRQIDPTRPICFDSGYGRSQIKDKPDSTFFTKYDDGDIDDGHNYSGWYKGTIFNNFIETPFQKRKTEGRPLISQEWSTGYPNTETGHHTRNYLWQHQNIQTHVGNQGYPFGNPEYSLQNNAFLSSELAEAIRRTHDQLAGMHHFSSLTWFRNVYDAQKVEPYPTYYRMQNSLNPILVSAELFGRHFYAGNKLPVRFCIVNDKVDGEILAATTLKWEITYNDNRIISSGTYEMPKVAHYSREWLTPEIIVPTDFNGERLDGKLRLYLTQNGQELARNEYNLLFAKQAWVQPDTKTATKPILVDLDGKTATALDYLAVAYVSESNLVSALGQKSDLYIISGLATANALTEQEVAMLQDKFKNGGKILLLNSGDKLLKLFPKYISGYLPNQLETVNIDIPESGVFNDIKLMDLRYFNNDKPGVPLVNIGLVQVLKHTSVQPLVSGCQHRYARGNDRRAEMLTMKGFPILSISDKGKVIISEMMTEKSTTDPVMGKLLLNMIEDLVIY